MALKNTVEEYERVIIANAEQKHLSCSVKLKQQKDNKEISVDEYNSKMKKIKRWEKCELKNAWKKAHELAGLKFFDDELY